MTLKDLRPYLLAAHVQWLDDSGAAPHLVINNGPNVKFPPHLAAAPALTFKVTAEAVENLMIDEDGVSFNARFNGKAAMIFAPFSSITKLHSADGKVMMDLQPAAANEVLPKAELPQAVEVAPPPPPPKARPKFGLITGGKSDASQAGNKSALSIVPR